MSLLIDALRQALAGQQIVSLYFDDQNRDRLVCGRVAAMDESHVLLHGISRRGAPDGLLLLRRESIHALGRGGQYERRLEVLARHCPTTQDDITLPSNLSQGLAYALMDMARQQRIIGIKRDADEPVLFGLLEQHDNQALVLHVVDEYGRDDGQQVITGQDYLWLEADSLDCKDLEALRANG